MILSVAPGGSIIDTLAPRSTLLNRFAFVQPGALPVPADVEKEHKISRRKLRHCTFDESNI
jgi:hypothetical protein